MVRDGIRESEQNSTGLERAVRNHGIRTAGKIGFIGRIMLPFPGNLVHLPIIFIGHYSFAMWQMSRSLFCSKFLLPNTPARRGISNFNWNAKIRPIRKSFGSPFGHLLLLLLRTDKVKPAIRTPRFKRASSPDERTRSAERRQRPWRRLRKPRFTDRVSRRRRPLESRLPRVAADRRRLTDQVRASPLQEYHVAAPDSTVSP